MSWRLLLFGAAVIVVLFGGWSVVFSSGSPNGSPGSSVSQPRRTEQQIAATWMPYPTSSTGLGCPAPSNLTEEPTVLCLQRVP